MSLNFPLISEGPTSENLTFKMGSRVKLEIELRISCSDTMLDYRLSQKLKLLGNGEFNHLTISLTRGNLKSQDCKTSSSLLRLLQMETIGGKLI